MKTTPLVLILFLTALGLMAQTPDTPPVSPAGGAAPQKEVPGYDFDWPGVDVNQVLEVYSKMVGRTMLRGNVSAPSIILKTQSPLTKTEAIEALQAVLALNGIVVVNIGDKFMKVLPPDQAGAAGGSLNSVDASQLPELGTYVTHIAQLKYVKPSVVIPLIQSFGKLQGNLFAIDDNGILVMRDYAENVKRMLEMIDKIDVSVPAVYVSEVIPIRYAQADDIANALNSLGGTGSATVSMGGSAGTPTINGVAGNRTSGSGFGGMGNTTPQQSGVNNNAQGSTLGQPRTGLGTTANPNGTPSSATPFQQRLMNIINRAGSSGGGGGQEPIQIFGQAKIIADERANALLVFATRQDMDQIKEVISKLDVLLSQVLIESVIIDYALGPDTLNVGVSAAQSPQSYSSSPPITSGGGYNNGQQLYNFLHNAANASNGNTTNFINGLGGGLSYFGNIGPNWNVALSAAAADSHASVIQRPRIQTSQAKPAQFFVGNTVPYVTSTANYGGAYGNQSSYSQLSVGVELDVTPFINPDGLVVMQIQQEIDDLDGYTTITGVGQIPNTIKRTLNSEITVSNRDTVMLGGFIKNAKSTSRSGVPLLQDIPLLGALFSQRNSSKQREELIVLMRPTVLKTPEIAAVNTIREEQRLPGASAAAADEGASEQKITDAERKKELSHPKTMSAGFYNQHIPTNPPADQVSPPVAIPMPQDQPPQPQAQGDGFFTPVAPNAPVVQPDVNGNAAPPQ
jgi:general secretion pathway protein D